jgi:hypothetical protein
MSNSVEITDRITPKLNAISVGKKDIVSKAVRAGGNVLFARAKDAVGQQYFKANSAKKGKKPLSKDIYIKQSNNGDVKVGIWPQGRLKWFESGTKVRRVKSGANRGQIQATHFFQQTISTSQQAIATAIARAFDAQLKNYGNK